MKFLLLFLISFSAFGRMDFDVVSEVKSISLAGNTYTVTLWQTNEVFRIAKKNKVIPCLENAYKANMNVGLKIDKKNGAIEDCRMVSGPHPGL